MRRPFTEAEDLELLRLAERGDTWVDIGLWLGRPKQVVHERHRTLTRRSRENGGARIARPGGSFGAHLRLSAIEDAPRPADDAGHIRTLRKLGGFDIRNQWSSQQGRALP